MVVALDPQRMAVHRLDLLPGFLQEDESPGQLVLLAVRAVQEV